MRDNADQNNSEYGHFSRSETNRFTEWIERLYICDNISFRVYKNIAHSIQTQKQKQLLMKATLMSI